MKSLKSKAALAACVVSLSSSTALAADPATVEKPEVKVGLSWRMAVTDGMTKNPISENTYTVVSANDSEVVIHNAAGEEAVVLDAAHYAVKRLLGRAFEPPMQRFSFPITVGKRWESAYRYDNPACGMMDAKLSFKAAGWDDITTPAGKFRALRIESDGRWRCGQAAGQFNNKHWTVPDLPVPLKLETIVNSMGRMHSFEVHELLSVTKP